MARRRRSGAASSGAPGGFGPARLRRLEYLVVVSLVLFVAVLVAVSLYAGLDEIGGELAKLTPGLLAGLLGLSLLNYGLHEAWTFASKDRKPSAKRGGLYLLALGATVGVRVATVAVLEATLLPRPEQALAVLVAATGLSFATNYILSKYVVFRPGRAAPEQP